MVIFFFGVVFYIFLPTSKHEDMRLLFLYVHTVRPLAIAALCWVHFCLTWLIKSKLHQTDQTSDLLHSHSSADLLPRETFVVLAVRWVTDLSNPAISWPLAVLTLIMLNYRHISGALKREWNLSGKANKKEFLVYYEKWLKVINMGKKIKRKSEIQTKSAF